MNAELSWFQDSFIRALYGDETSALALQPGFRVYRNSVFKALVEALKANFPTVVQLVGVDWFDNAAAVYVRRDVPRDSRLLLYGDDFPNFLAIFGPAGALPYLPGVACLDRAWRGAHTAADALPLSVSELSALPVQSLGSLVLRPHPSARWLWFDNVPAYTIWRANREGTALDDALPWTGDGALITRRDGAVIWTALDQAGCCFLDACNGGADLATASMRAETDLAALFSCLIGAGAFSSLNLGLTEQ